MSPTGSVTLWLAQLKLGDSDAAQRALWDRYFQQLASLARRKLGALARASDEEDVVLSALDSFFRGARLGRFPLLVDRSNLWPLLVKITARKACNQRKHERAARRGGGRVRGESALRDGPPSLSHGLEWVDADAPTPEFLAEVSEECRHRLDRLGDDALRRVAIMKLSGFTNAEIAAEFQVVERTIERKLERIRRLWSEENQA